MDDKICPLMSVTVVLQDSYGVPFPATEMVDCQTSKCAFWATVYTTEGSTINGCCIEFKPHMNSEGRYVV